MTDRYKNKDVTKNVFLISKQRCTLVDKLLYNSYWPDILIEIYIAAFTRVLTPTTPVT